jgi:hypothetical protein
MMLALEPFPNLFARIEVKGVVWSSDASLSGAKKGDFRRSLQPKNDRLTANLHSADGPEKPPGHWQNNRKAG